MNSVLVVWLTMNSVLVVWLTMNSLLTYQILGVLLLFDSVVNEDDSLPDVSHGSMLGYHEEQEQLRKK